MATFRAGGRGSRQFVFCVWMRSVTLSTISLNRSTGLPVGNGQLTLQKLAILAFLLPLMFCEPWPNPPTSGLLGLAAGRRLAVLLLLLLLQGWHIRDCSFPPVDLNQHEEQNQDESFFRCS